MHALLISVATANRFFVPTAPLRPYEVRPAPAAPQEAGPLPRPPPAAQPWTEAARPLGSAAPGGVAPLSSDADWGVLGFGAFAVPLLVVGAFAVAAASPREKGLALQLDQGTRKSHSVAENSAFVTGFFRGMAEERSFRQLVASLFFVYEAMEGAFDATGDERVRALDFPELRRLPALEKDMAYFYGPDWRAKVRPTPATQAYVASIKKAAAEQPELLIAHQYSRYLGDLFGGQMMSGMASKSLGLTSDGLAFYTFDNIPSPSAFITEWYSRLNELELTDVQKEEIVEEANVVFRHNIAIFDELEGNPVAAMVRIAWKTGRAKVKALFSGKN